jgi:2-polyprenyl-3-methyl-5-hydroxy-6-metoxy-1,4-benzoquinol methylase
LPAIGSGKTSKQTCIGCTSSNIEITHDVCDWICDYKPEESEINKELCTRCDRLRLNPFTQLLRDTNLFKNKHIPVAYIINDKETRLQLLAGFIDTDGTIKENNTSAVFIEISQSKRLHENLIHAIDFIAKSLGYEAKGVPYNRDSRKFGSSKFSLYKIVRLGLSGLFNHSAFPAKFSGLVSILALSGTLLLLIYVFLSKILEIGSNDGTLLKLLKKKCSLLLAVDPAKHLFKDRKIKNIGDHFSLKLSNKIKNSYGKFDVIIANNVLANINDLDDIFKGIEKILNIAGYLVVETFSLYGVLQKNLVDNIYHEHLSYFTIPSLLSLQFEYFHLVYH